MNPEATADVEPTTRRKPVWRASAGAVAVVLALIAGGLVWSSDDGEEVTIDGEGIWDVASGAEEGRTCDDALPTFSDSVRYDRPVICWSVAEQRLVVYRIGPGAEPTRSVVLDEADPCVTWTEPFPPMDWWEIRPEPDRVRWTICQPFALIDGVTLVEGWSYEVVSRSGHAVIMSYVGMGDDGAHFGVSRDADDPGRTLATIALHEIADRVDRFLGDQLDSLLATLEVGMTYDVVKLPYARFKGAREAMVEFDLTERAVPVRATYVGPRVGTRGLVFSVGDVEFFVNPRAATVAVVPVEG